MDGGGGDPLRCPVGWDVPIANRAWVVLAVDGVQGFVSLVLFAQLHA